MSLFSLFGCVHPNRYPQDSPNPDEVAKSIVQAFEDDNVEPIEGVLSQSALNTSDLEQGLKYGNETLGDDLGTEVKYLSEIESDDWIDGKHDKRFDYAYSVISNGKEYILEFEIYAPCESDPSKTGLYRVSFLTKQDNDIAYDERQAQLENGESSSWNYGATYERAGIYNPEWQTTPPPNGDTSQRY